ncbi:hypothetical protein IS717_003023, partial [Escherichia coli]|nr:hypothetical protein [Escherichia coli]EGO4015117.1 hypothetical protein [Escherichia coli]
QYVHNGGTASGTVVNSDGWQIIKEGGLADFTTVNNPYLHTLQHRTYHGNGQRLAVLAVTPD